jgi:hypothetical protein
MKKSTLRGIALAAITGMVLSAYAQDSIDQSQFPTILQQPVDQCLPMGAPATFTVVATNTDGYQWYKNNTALDGQTNSSLTIPSVSTNDVGYYSAMAIKGSEGVPTRAANMIVYIRLGSTSGSSSTLSPMTRTASLSTSLSSMSVSGGGAILAYGYPVASGGSSGTCPGKYSGYVNFTKTPSDGWGWAPSTNTTVHTATDGNRTDTKVLYTGGYGDSGCAQTTVTVPHPPISPAYDFTIYFPQGVQVPTNGSYAITLSGFDP